MPNAPVSWSDDTHLPRQAGLLLDALRSERTRVHAITNGAAQVFTANLLLAAGGIPSLTYASKEVQAFTARAAALLINLGTLDGDRRESIPQAIVAARTHRRPWVLDPVFVDASPPRLDLARRCIADRPNVIRCNAAEFSALAATEARPEAVRAFACETESIIALTGPVDLVTDGERSITIHNGHVLMSRVTAMGCAATALVAAFVALHQDVMEAAAAALLVIGIAGEIAAERSAGPGTFQPAFLDALHTLDGTTISTRARTS